MSNIDPKRLKYFILLALSEQKSEVIPQGELVNTVADKLGLTENARNEHYEGRTNDKKFYKMVATNEQRLKAAGLENFYKTGHKITKEGIIAVEVNKEKQEINYDYLRSIHAYTEWEERLGIAPKDRKKIIENDNVFVVPTRKKHSLPKNNSDKTFNETELIKVITKIQNDFKSLEWYYRLYEENVRVELVEPILKAIGWTAPYIRREERNMDYLLSDEVFINEDCNKLVIEVKKYQEQLITIGENMEPKNELQLIEYCTRIDKEFPFAPLAGILTNGIRWCIYLGNGYEYKGEIDLMDKNTNIDSYIRFFRAISRNELYMINELDWKWLTQATEKEEIHPKKIFIVNEGLDGTITDSYCFVVKQFIDKCTNPSDYIFYKDVILKEKKGQYKPYGNHIINVKYGVYDMIALMQTINATLDLGLEIIIK